MYGLICMHAHAGPGGVPHNISFMSPNTDSNSRSGSYIGEPNYGDEPLNCSRSHMRKDKGAVYLWCHLDFGHRNINTYLAMSADSNRAAGAGIADQQISLCLMQVLHKESITGICLVPSLLYGPI